MENTELLKRRSQNWGRARYKFPSFGGNVSNNDNYNSKQYGGISMTKYNNQELISDYPNCTSINLKLNGNKPILCFKSGMHQTEAERQKPVSGVMQLVKIQKGILSSKRYKAKRHNAKRDNAKRHNATRHNAKRHNA